MRRRKLTEPPIPQLITRVNKELPEVPGQFAANMLWLQTNSGHFTDRWVALYNGKLVTSAATQEDLNPGIVNHPFFSNILVLKVGRDYINDTSN